MFDYKSNFNTYFIILKYPLTGIYFLSSAYQIPTPLSPSLRIIFLRWVSTVLLPEATVRIASNTILSEEFFKI